MQSVEVVADDQEVVEVCLRRRVGPAVRVYVIPTAGGIEVNVEVVRDSHCNLDVAYHLTTWADIESAIEADKM